MRKIIVVLAAVVGLIAIVGSSIAWHFWLQQRPVAHHNKAEVVTYSTDTPSEDKPGDNYNWQGAANDPKKIIIPSIGVDAYLQNVGIDQKKEIAIPNNIHMGGWFVDSVRPGDKGLSIIDGHLNGHTQDGVFVSLKQLKVGDTYTVTFGNNQALQFSVVKIATVSLAEAPSVLFSQDQSIARQLNLITCGGEWDKDARLYDKRVIVISEAVSRT